jgi:hypothetical protein
MQRDRARIAYLYPTDADPALRDRYQAEVAGVVRIARAHGAQIAVVKLPLPDRFRALLPDEAAFDAALSQVLEAEGLDLQDHAALVPDPKLYFDTDHLNRAGVTAYLDAGFLALLETSHR